MEEEKSSLEQTLEEVAPEEQESHSQESEPVQANQDTEKDNSKEFNIRRLREEKDRAQKERDEYYRRLQDLEKQALEAQKPKDESYTPPAPDDLVEWRQVERELKRRDEENKRYRQQAELSSTEARLKAKFSDFDSIVSSENISLLNAMEPELAESIAANPNMYNKAIAAYKAIKRLTPKDNFIEDKDRVMKNTAKPRPSNAASAKSDSPLSKANAFSKGLSKEQKERIYKEMQDIIG